MTFIFLQLGWEVFLLLNWGQYSLLNDVKQIKTLMRLVAHINVLLAEHGAHGVVNTVPVISTQIHCYRFF